MHKYLRMNLDYREQGKVKINMTDYLKKILDEITDKYQGKAITPAENNLFEVNETVRKLIERDAQAFHTIVAKVIYLCMQARPDILNGVDFITMRVREPGKDKEKKLGRTLKYISGTRDIVLTL